VRTRTNDVLLVGGYAVRKIGVGRFDWRDPYYFAVTLSWPVFLVSLIALFLAINLAFALIYLSRLAVLAGNLHGAFSDALFFSFETATTVGYGDIYPAGHFGRVVAGTEMMFGVAYTALTTGLLFVRFSRPKAGIRYAKNAVIASHDGSPTLMIRIANGRFSLIANASAHIALIGNTRSSDGRTLRQVRELPLLRTQLPIFSTIWTVMHRIDPSSPLYGCDHQRLMDDDIRVLLSVEGYDASLATTIIDTRAYGPSDILCDMRYSGGMISEDAQGRPVVDLSQLSQIEPDSGPEPQRDGWVDDR
jgi:inward rectifier potassium channel